MTNSLVQTTENLMSKKYELTRFNSIGHSGRRPQFENQIMARVYVRSISTM